MRVKALVVVERVGIWWTKRLLNTCTREWKIPEEWKPMLIVPPKKTIKKEKKEMYDPGKYSLLLENGDK